jgi:hypothetical protein
MALPQYDTEFLRDRGLDYEVTADAGMTCVVFRAWGLPTGYDRSTADLLLRLPAQYPDTAPDMWWFEPAVNFADGRRPQATEATEQHLGRTWQRWSRHFSAGQWQSGIDGLENYLALIRRDLERAVPVVAA